MSKKQISESALARKIGISQSLLNSYTTGSRAAPKTKRIIDALVNYFKDSHPEIYDIFGLPHSNELDKLPKDFTDRLNAAHSGYIEEIASRGISKDSPEALEIFKKFWLNMESTSQILSKFSYSFVLHFRDQLIIVHIIEQYFYLINRFWRKTHEKTNCSCSIDISTLWVSIFNIYIHFRRSNYGLYHVPKFHR